MTTANLEKLLADAILTGALRIDSIRLAQMTDDDTLVLTSIVANHVDCIVTIRRGRDDERFDSSSFDTDDE